MSNQPSNLITLFKAAAIAAALTLTFVFGAGLVKTRVEDDVLAFTLPDLNAAPVSLSDDRFAGKVVLVDIWGTWCPPCIEQIPMLTRLQEKHRASGFEIVGIEFWTFATGTPEEHREAIRGFVEDRGINYTVLVGGSTDEVGAALPGLQNFKGFPTSIFIGRDGTVRRIKTGFSGSEIGWYEKTVERLLNEPAAAEE